MNRALIIIGILLFFIQCDFLLNPRGEPDYTGIIYQNSFETPADLVGWNGYASIQLFDEAAPGGGEKSLYVSGGCIVPHAVYDVGPVKRDMYLTVEAWGKALQGSGGLGIYKNSADFELHEGIGFAIDDSEWLYYTSDDKLYLRKGDVLTIHVNAGGFVPGSVLVDLLKIREVR